MKPKRKLFLSWMAVREALLQGTVQDAYLKDCLFSTSAGELILAQAFDRAMFARVLPNLLQAAKDGRLAYYDSIEHLNGTTPLDVQALLDKNGVSALECQPLRVDLPDVQAMQTARQRQIEEDTALIASGGKLDNTCGNWMCEIKEALARRT